MEASVDGKSHGLLLQDERGAGFRVRMERPDSK